MFKLVTLWICIVYTILIWHLWSTYSRSFFSANGCILFKVIKALISKEWHYVRHCIYYLYYTYKHKYIPRVVKPHLWKLEKEGHGACLRKCTHHTTLLLHLCVCLHGAVNTIKKILSLQAMEIIIIRLCVCIGGPRIVVWIFVPNIFAWYLNPKIALCTARNCDNFTIK